MQYEHQIKQRQAPARQINMPWEQVKMIHLEEVVLPSYQTKKKI